MLFNHLKKLTHYWTKIKDTIIFVLLIFLIQMFLELFSVALFIPLISFLTETDCRTLYIYFSKII